MRGKKILPVLLVVICVLALVPAFSSAKTVEELRAELNEKREALKSTEEKIAEFRQTVQEKKQEARTLADQITLIDDNITSVELNIQRTEQEIEQINVEIETVEQEIEVREGEIARQKKLLADYIRALYEFDQQSTVAVLFKYQTFAEGMNEQNTISELQNRAQQTLISIQDLHKELLVKRRELEDFKQSLEALRNQQAREQEILETQRTSKARILELTNEQEAQYSALLQDAQQAHQSANASIKELDARIREELRAQGLGALPSIGILDWPVDPIFGISCSFHCGGYPYAYLIGPHSGIDIPTYVGTPIKAPAEGYVARTHDSGGPGYSYIMLIHGDNVSTVYGHVSGFAVNEGQVVTRGTTIGYTGGAPGSRGAGLSSGPHLHFEVRQNNVPVNPEKFLK